jgi:hypothetical protein
MWAAKQRVSGGIRQPVPPFSYPNTDRTHTPYTYPTYAFISVCHGVI